MKLMFVLTFAVAALSLPCDLSAKKYILKNFNNVEYPELMISPDGSHVMLSYKKKGDSYDYDYIQIDDYADRGSDIKDFQFSETGNRAVYIKENGGKGEAIFIENGRRKTLGPAFHIKINRDGSNYIITNEGYVYVKQKRYGPFNEIKKFGFNPEGSISWFTAYDKNSRQHIQINDKTFGPYNYIREPVFSKLNGRYAFSFERGRDGFCNIDGIDHKYPSEKEENVHLKYSPDGSRIFFIPNFKGMTYRDDIVIGTYDEADHLVSSDDGGSYAFRFEKFTASDFCFAIGCLSFVNIGHQAEYCCSLQWLNPFRMTSARSSSIKRGDYVRFNDREMGRFEDVGNLKVSADGRSFSFDYWEDKQKSYENKCKYFVRFNDKTYGPYAADREASLVMSESGTHVAFCYTTQKDISFIHHNNLIYKFPDCLTGKDIGITSDGTRVCSRMWNREGVCITVNDKISGPFKEAAFSVRGNKISAAYLKGNELILEEL